MNRVINLAIPALMVASLAGSATAQVVHDHRKPKPPPALATSITTFAPAGGVVGTRVELRGSGFQPGDQIILSNATIVPLSVEPGRIIFAVPAGAGSGPLVLVRGGQRLLASSTNFKVLEAAPSVTALEPPRAQPGAVVRVRGANLATINGVLMGKRPLAIKAKGPDFVDVVVPLNASAGDFLWVKGPGGEARSPAALVVDVMPIIKRVEPTFVRPGESITLWGGPFSGGDRVTLGGVALHISQLFGDRIVAAVPQGAVTGDLALERGTYRVVAAARFEVVQRPQIVAITPPAGQPGTAVVVRVRNDSADLGLFYGVTQLKIEKRAAVGEATDLSITVPRGATDQVISVRSRGGEDRWGSPFQVYIFPIVAGISPARAWERTQVTLTGKHMMQIDQVWLGAVALPIDARNPGSLTLTIPANTPGGLISVASHGQRIDTKLRLDVVLRAAIDRFSPGSGMPGSEVLITGRNFEPSTKVLLGNVEMPILRAQLPTQIWVQVPAEATGPERISVGEGGVMDTARDPFVAIAAPAIADFSPRIAKPGMEVVLSGNQLGGQVEILLGTTPLAITRVEQGRIAVRLPVATPVGKQFFQIRAGGAIVARSRAPLDVIRSATMSMFTPRRAQPGHLIHIKGSGFDTGIRVFFGKTELQVTRIGPKGAQMWALIPDGLVGTDYVIVDDFGVRSQTDATLTIDAPGPPPPPPAPPTGTIHDHRKKPK